MAPIRLLESNPHYFDLNGKSTVLITSAEHYGALLNLDFDYVRYLDTLAACGFNLTRVFAGTYREIPGSFGIVGNTLAPADGRFLAPWARGDEPGYPHGGNKFDLSRFDESYFARLRDLLAQAERCGVVVELVLFCFLYNDALWAANPMNAACNVNGIGQLADRHDAYSLSSGPLLAAQEQFVRRIVTECNRFDHLYWEIINEPYARHDGSAFLDWQRHMADVIAETERGLPKRHLIAQNIQNRRMAITDPHPAVSILNFHYADPEAVAANYHLGRVIGDDETGFKGQASCPYRTEAWRFLLSGGGVFNHLDYSYTAARPDGTAAIERESPSFGGPAWRAELKVLKEFMDGLPLERMSPHGEVLNLFGSQMGSSMSGCALADPGRCYAVYLSGGGYQVRLGLGIPKGTYQLVWLRTTDGHRVREETVDHQGEALSLVSPLFAEDIALRVDAV
jgi:hypothetical protein